MENTIAYNALSNKRGTVIIGLLGEWEHTVIVTPFKQPALRLSGQTFSLQVETEIVIIRLREK